jgi:hypothetical protein
MPEIRIQPGIFEEYPTFRRGIVIAKNLDNQDHSRELEDMLNRATSQAEVITALLSPQNPGYPLNL